MKTGTKLYIAFVFVAALAAALAMYLLDPTFDSGQIEALAFFSVVAIVSEMLAFTLARETRGSVAFIPYFASVILVPNWTAVVAGEGGEILMGKRYDNDAREAIFYTSKHGPPTPAGIGGDLCLGGGGPR